MDGRTLQDETDHTNAVHVGKDTTQIVGRNSLRRIQLVRQHKNISARFEWVRSHQDEHAQVEDMEAQAILNVWADALNYEA